MKKRSNDIDIDEITKKEISAVETSDRLVKLEKERVRDKKVIAEYKEREKATARALVLYERKIKWLKESLIEELLNVCKLIDAHKEKYNSLCESIYNREMKDEFSAESANFTLFNEKIYEICNIIEANAQITKSDRDFISNRKDKKVEEKQINADERFNRLKQEFAQKIGASVLRKPGRPKKEDQSIVSSIGLGHKPEKDIKVQDDIKGKLDDLFYSAPHQKTVASSIPQTNDSMFDFNEALNPNISLKDIMADLMSEKDDEETKTYGVTDHSEEIKKAQQKSKIELLESGFMTRPLIQNKDVKPRTIDQQQKKPTFEKRFLSIQEIVKETKE